MRLFLVSSIVGLAVAVPAPQDIDFDLAYAVPNPTFSIDPTATAQTVSYEASTILAAAQSQITASVTGDPVASTESTVAPDAPNGNDKRADCAAQPSGYGPASDPPTDAGFAASSLYQNAAQLAATPPGYTNTFTNLNASNNAYGYLGFTTLTSYNTTQCAEKCNNINGCMSINIYFERDPSLAPAAACPNPSPTTNIKCVFWGGPVNADNALNFGQYRQDFHVVIAGSNGYTNNSIVPPPGYSQPLDLGNAAINAPYDAYGANTYLGSAIFSSGPFNASLCATACSQKSAYALANPPTDGSLPQTCQFFNTYILYINNTKNLQGQYCAMYSESWPASYATNVGQYRGSDHFLIEYSYAYSNTTNPGYPNKVEAIDQATQAISYSTLQSFCSTLLGYTINYITAISTVTASQPVVTTTTTVVTAEECDIETTTTITPQKRDTPATSLSTPNALSHYPPSIVASACQAVLTSSPAASTISTTTTITPPTSTVFLTSYSTYLFTSVTATASVIANTYSCPQQGTDGTQLDPNSVDTTTSQYHIGCGYGTSDAGEYYCYYSVFDGSCLDCNVSFAPPCVNQAVSSS